MLLGNGGDGEGGVLICFGFLYYNDERDEGQTLWFALVWKILSKRGWEKEGGVLVLVLFVVQIRYLSRRALPCVSFFPLPYILI